MRLNINKALEYVATENIALYQQHKPIQYRLDSVYELLYNFLKRFVDIVFALVCISMFFPFWIVITLLVKFTSKGPVFYKAKVTGLDQQTFVMYKFRTMFNNCSVNKHKDLVNEMIKKNKHTEKIKNDNRITPIGKFLRKYSIDEFPQLLNVLKGDMSVVGPRPCLPYEYEIMSNWHKQRFAVKPGITGLWQVTGRNKIRFNEQIALDLLYIENRSLLLDLKIMLHTIPVVVLGLGGA